MKASLPALLPLLLLTAGLAACGQTGPLHLPQDAPRKERYLVYKRETPAAAPANAATPPPTGPASDPVPPDAVAPDSEAPNAAPRPISP